MTVALRNFLILPVLALPGAAGAVDPDPRPATPGAAASRCESTRVFDPAVQACVEPAALALSDDARYALARDLAAAGRYPAALATLDSMAEGDTDRVLTWRGYVLRKSGDWPAAQAAYAAALARNPDNLTARSYFGLGHLTQGDLAAAHEQLNQIRARGGRGSPAEIDLLAAMTAATPLDY